MKTIALIIILFLLSSPLFSQNTWMDAEIHTVPCKNNFIKAESDQSQEEAVKIYIISHIPAFNTDGVSIKLNAERESPIGTHYDFIQTFRGLEIYGSEVKINLGKDKKIMSFFEKIRSIGNFELKGIQAFNENAVKRSLGGDDIIINGFSRVIFIAENEPVQSWLVDYGLKGKSNSFSVIFNDQYDILYRKDNSMYYSSHDSVVKAMVFLPDPLSTANIAKGISPYLNYNDSAVPAIDSQRKPVYMTAKYEKDSATGKDSFYLESPYIRFVDAAAPYTGVTFSRQPLFDFYRDKPAFHDVMIYYHLNTHQQHIRKLGISNLVNYQLQVDGHYSYDDNSRFITNPLQKNNILVFGVGGIPDAEDADVIVHEYTHAVRESASPNTFNGADRMAAEEGFCDYFACSYSKMLTLNQWKKMFNWDGDGEFWDGRTCFSTKVYPKDLRNDIHIDAEIFSGALMDIYDDLGRDTTDLLMLTAMYSLTNNMKMPAIARLYLEADSTMNKGRHANSIITHFVRHGLLDPNVYQGIEVDNATSNTSEVVSRYFSNDGILYVRFEHPQTGRVCLYSLDGKEILSSDFNSQSALTFYRPELAAGLYVLHITTPKAQHAYKLMKN
jgi:hypothetical protein